MGIPLPTLAQEGVAARELAAVELLSPLPECALQALARRAWSQRYSAGETIFAEGEFGDCLYVLRTGFVEVVRPSQDPAVVLTTLGPGRSFGELAVLDSERRSASVLAGTECEAIKLARDDLAEVLDAHPEAVRAMLGRLARSLTLAREEVARHNRILEDRVIQRTQELHESQLEVIRRLGQAAESRDDDTGGHINRMSRMVGGLARAAGMSQADSEELMLAAPMHDIGKIGIPDRILRKPGKLDAGEWEIMKTHTTIGARLLAGSRSPVVRLAESIALSHHERWDGTGYPAGLAGRGIPLPSRVCALCDVFDALISTRPYKDAWSPEEALAEIRRQSGRAFDPDLVALFVAGFQTFCADVDPDLRGAGTP